MIWERVMLSSKKCLSPLKFNFMIFDFKNFGYIRTTLINRFVTMKGKMLDCAWDSYSLICDTIIDLWRSYVAVKRFCNWSDYIMLVETSSHGCVPF
ncbi:hypothetical protein CEXT_535141 [Caerostris extrusa]|uniref:Uncharacterized protein n=1 Tax=Caerostris extrusa TaxID=172846 RepID=A0AAV4RGU7_CAEEX|nr:hypothetical protein CEXT_535141 [Caerostris extrusa]